MVKRSHKYEKLLWGKTLKIIKACLYKTCCLTGSQCSLMSAGVICSNLPARSTTRANVFCTRCSFCSLNLLSSNTYINESSNHGLRRKCAVLGHSKRPAPGIVYNASGTHRHTHTQTDPQLQRDDVQNSTRIVSRGEKNAWRQPANSIRTAMLYRNLVDVVDSERQLNVMWSGAMRIHVWSFGRVVLHQYRAVPHRSASLGGCRSW